MPVSRCLFGCFVLLTAITLASSAVAPDIEWSRTLTDAQVATLADVIQTDDGGYVVFGTRTNDDGISQMVLLKFDAVGDLVWETAYGDKDSETAWSMIVRQDGGYLLAGTRTEQWGTSRSTVIHWVSETGELENTEDRPYSEQWDLLYPLVYESRDGVFTELGTWVSAEGNGIEYRTTWRLRAIAFRDFRCLAFDSRVLTDAIVFDDGSAIFLANDESSEMATGQAADTGSHLISLPPTGNCDWTQPVAGVGRALARTSDNHLIIAGSFQGHSYVAKTDDACQLLWSQTYLPECSSFALAVEATEDGGAVVTGRTSRFEGPAGVLVFRVDTEGTLLWSKVLGQAFDIGVSIHTTSDGGSIVGALCGREGYGCGGIRIIKLAPDLE